MDLEILISIAAIVVLLLLSGLFSGSETALTAASRAQMLSLAKQGSRRAELVNFLSDHKERLIGSILLGNNLVNILASALATSLLIGIFGDAGVAYATVVMTALVLIFAEVLPKTYAIHNANRFALAMAPLIGPMVRLLAPLVHLVQLIVALCLRLVGVQVGAGGHLVSSAEELKGTAELHTQEGRMVKADRDMLGGILDLPDVQVSEIMVHRRNMVMIDVGQSSEEIVAEALESPYTRVPLWRDDPENIFGILHAKDLLRALGGPGGEAGSIDMAGLARTPWFVPETTTLMEQLNAFRARHEHFALVVDEYGALMGLVTLEDILEEIVGEIADEHDVVMTDAIRRQPDGSLIVDGTVTVRDLNRFGDWELPDEEAATIAGLVIHEARRIPEVGERFSFYGFRFEILRRQRNRITALGLKPEA
ncbi:MAG: HlyC/CorC family transporter [Alphaproteobacteria bacterium]|nr:HlyC/CorC family transporter [Alphaproteobacteria bacterium]